MGALVWGLLAVCCLSGFLLFRRRTLPAGLEGTEPARRLSIVIPARNEEANLPSLLESLRSQTFRPWEIVVVNDGSEDRTKEIALSFGCTVLDSPELPEGWTGKNWAVWNGYQRTSGDLIAFLDSDIRLAPTALASLVRARERAGGAISVVPFHAAGKFYEKLALLLNLLGVFAFTSFFERSNPRQGLYGSCIVVSREDYDRMGGHAGVRSEVLDDLSLGARFGEAGIPVANFIGAGLVSFRMYPQGIVSEIQGFAKSAVLSTGSLRPGTIALVAAWVVGLIASESFFIFLGSSWAIPLAAGYLLFTLQIVYFTRYVGRFGAAAIVLHPLSTLFFLIVMAYSAYQVVFRKQVIWKGRQVKVGGKLSV
ncbi:glycosyltransferase [Cohnella zeiphila]|uniref:4,4'-diaponeurosporenoate glycosyltransferase n=1 Tax=Cohnella zeiphila TaxID=2761120 RepID=A0A7X0SNJ8_9BACL|nr:glycosyltransferase [Cohnella zeiphila]MBB6733121.1 glycosyltransferase [Cohnella zeiphila]